MNVARLVNVATFRFGNSMLRPDRRVALEITVCRSRLLQGLLKRNGYEVGRLHVATLMKIMGTEAIYRRPNTLKPARRHKIFPHLLR